jgi:hypothetical protein
MHRQQKRGSGGDGPRFSFAQVREAYILAGQFAFDRDEDVTPDDLMQAARK